MRTLALALVSLAALVGAGVVFAPASLVDARLAALTGNRARLAASEGTLWRGSGSLVLDDGTDRLPIGWHVEPWPLLRGEAHIALAPPSDAPDAPRGRVVMSANRVHVELLEWSLPAESVAQRIPTRSVHAGGAVRVLVEDLVVARSVERGSVRIEWHDARLAADARSPVELGTVSASLAARDGALKGPVTGRGGTIRIDGEAALGSDAGRLDVRLAPEPSATPDERALLARLGAPAPDGSVSLNVAGKWPR